MPLSPMFVAFFFVSLLGWPHVLAVCHFILTFIGLEAVENILTKLEINVYWHLIGVA